MSAPLTVAGLPNPAGGLYYGGLTATLPTDAIAALDASLTYLGRVSSEGVTESHSTDSNNVTDWLGGLALVLRTSYTETYKLILIDILRADVQKLVYGDDNVTSVAATADHGNQLTVSSTGLLLPNKAIVTDMLSPNGAAMRKVLPNAQVTDFGDVKWTNSDAVGYEVTITAYKDTAGKFSYFYSDDGEKLTDSSSSSSSSSSS